MVSVGACRSGSISLSHGQENWWTTEPVEQGFREHGGKTWVSIREYKKPLTDYVPSGKGEFLQCALRIDQSLLGNASVPQSAQAICFIRGVNTMTCGVIKLDRGVISAHRSGDALSLRARLSGWREQRVVDGTEVHSVDRQPIEVAIASGEVPLNNDVGSELGLPINVVMIPEIAEMGWPAKAKVEGQ